MKIARHGLLLAVSLAFATQAVRTRAAEKPPEHNAAAPLPATKTFIYKKTKQADLQIVVHYPEGWKETDKRPGIVFFFGGGWMGGKISQFAPQAAHLAARGMVAARADYRVKSRHRTSPKECVEDAKSAVRWMRRNAATLGLDPERIVAAGGSAGGHIAACTALTPGLETEGEDLDVSSKPNALVLFNPVLRFSGIPELMGRIGADAALGKALSPTLNLANDSPPALILFGTADRLAAMGDEFMKKSKELGCRAELFTAPGQPHGFFNRPPWLETTTQRMDEFLVTLGYLEAKPAGAGPASPPGLTFTTRKPEDRIAATERQGVATWDVYCPSGIGGATVTAADGHWPKSIVLRLHLAGLEAFSVSNGKLKLAGSVLSHSGHKKSLSLTEEGKAGQREPGTEIKVFDAAGKPTAGLPGKGGYFEIVLPPTLLEGQPKSLELGWIDFFRG